MISRDYNIITGVPQKTYYKQQNSSTNYQPKFDLITQDLKKDYDLPKNKLQQLGRSADYKKDIGAQEVHSTDNIQNYQKQLKLQSRLINSVSTQYNILNNTKTLTNVYDKTLPGNTKIAYRKDAISKICDLGAIHARNLNQDFQEKFQNNEWAFHINKGSCAEIIEIGKGYGPKAKLFRKYK